MLEKILTDMAQSVEELQKNLEEYVKTLGNLNNKNWEADVRKAKSKGLLTVTVAKVRLKVLENEMTKLSGTGAGRREIAEKLMQISIAQERLKLAVSKAEDVLKSEVVIST